jgi:hypothetical protein
MNRTDLLELSGIYIDFTGCSLPSSAATMESAEGCIGLNINAFLQLIFTRDCIRHTIAALASRSK